MTEYINREDLIAACKKTHFAVNANDHPYDVVARVGKYFRKCVDEAPSADVVEVVRCKECIYYESNSCFNRQWDFESSTEIPMVRADDFCSYGERKENV